MRRRHFITALSGGIAGLGMGCTTRPPSGNRLFSFVHYSDVHIQPETGGKEGFLAAVDEMNSIPGVELAISGGDLIADALGQTEERANMLYDMYEECAARLHMPVYNCIGNHELLGLYVPDVIPETHPDWGKSLFRRRIGAGETYRSFDHGGIHFVLLDSIGVEANTDDPGHHYIGEIDAAQMNWLKQDLDGLPEGTPVIVVTHIPLLTLFPLIQQGTVQSISRSSIITNGKELYELLSNYRVFGVLQGHIHVNEDYRYFNTKYIDTAAVCGAWWGGPRNGHPEGFNLVHVYEDGIETEYMTYGWDASKYQQQEEVHLIPSIIRDSAYV